MSSIGSNFEAVPMIFAASVIYMIAASIACDNLNYCKNEWGYAVAVGVVSIIITGFLLLLRITKRTEILGRGHPIVSLFLFLWWGVGAGVGTFRGPFINVGNGYFAAWAAFLFSTAFAYETNAAVRTILDKGAHAMSGNHNNTNTNADAWNAGAADAPGTHNAGSV
jgi:hypothetical protein